MIKSFDYKNLPFPSSMRPPRRKVSDILSKAISQIDPKEKARTSQRMAIAVRISEALSKREMSKVQFAQLMGKGPSEITKWLSGTHNFTVDTLTDIGNALSINMFFVEQKPTIETKYVMVVSIPSRGQSLGYGQHNGYDKYGHNQGYNGRHIGYDQYSSSNVNSFLAVAGL